MKTMLAAIFAAAALLIVTPTAQAQGRQHSLKWHGPGILQGGDDDRGRVGGGNSYYIAPYYGGYGYSYGYPVYTNPYWYGTPVAPYGGYGSSYPNYSFPTYGYSYPMYYWGY